MRVDFDFINRRITMEGGGDDLVKVLKSVQEVAPHISEINLITSGSPAATAIGSTPTGSNVSSDNGESPALTGQTLKQFARALRLKNASERIAAIAYYNKHNMGEDTVSPKEMGRLFTICGFKKPTQMGVAFSDARRQHGYVESVGHGEWRITTNGENLIIGKLNEAEEQ